MRLIIGGTAAVKNHTVLHPALTKCSHKNDEYVGTDIERTLNCMH